jgi:putative ABC transport system permease protein
MLKIYFKIALRNLLKHKGYAAINISGLAIGLACSMIILIHIYDELSFDRFHVKADRIYRVTRDWRRPDGGTPAANTPAAIGPNLMAEYPAVEKFTRVMFPHPQSVLIGNGQNRFYETGFYWADSTFFEVFSFKLKRGDANTALAEANSLVLTERMARKYFGDQDPIGKTLTIESWSKDDYKITGILEEVPRNSHLQFDFLGSVRGADQRYSYLYSGEGQWVNSLGYTYILLREGASPADLNAQLADFGRRHLGEFAKERGFEPDFKLQPLTDIYLHSHLNVEAGPTSDIVYVYLFAVIAALILMIASINYMNLATARSAGRGREVGMRKVLGAQRGSLMRQFIGESLLMCFAALLLAMMVAELILPIFNSLSEKSLALNYAQQPQLLIFFIALAGAVALLAGSYPAFVLSGFRPVATLKGELKSGRWGLSLRQGLITFQFIASIILIIATTVVMKQLAFVRSQPLGFDQNQIAIIPIRDDEMRKHTESLKQEFLESPNIVSVSAAAGVPARNMLVDGFPVRPVGADRSAQVPMQIAGVDYDFFKTLGVKLVDGRFFQKEIRTDSASSFIINESAAKALGWDAPIGERIELVMDNGKRGAIIGVVQDFHFVSLHEKIEPMVFHIWPQRYSCFAVKMQTAAVSEAIAFLRSTWSRVAPERPFEFFFLDEEFGRQYAKDERVAKIFGYAASLAIFVACLGLFGLAAFSAEQRTKEIGVRKVLGASVTGIAGLLSKDFVKLVLAANLIAWPIAYFVMNKWLQNFAYRIDIGWWVFALAGGIALIIALLTVSYQAIRAALTNPVEALRYE